MQELKDKSLQAREAVKDDVASLESTADVLDLNQAKLDENNERLKAQVWEIWGDMGRCREIWGEQRLGRYGEMQGDAGRYGGSSALSTAEVPLRTRNPPKTSRASLGQG